MIVLKLTLEGPDEYYCECEHACDFCYYPADEHKANQQPECDLFNEKLATDSTEKAIRCKKCVDNTVRTSSTQRTIHRRGTSQNPFVVGERVRLRPRYNNGYADKTGEVITVEEFYDKNPYSNYGSYRQSYTVLWDNDGYHEPVHLECHLLEAIDEVSNG
jgi:hypothetical protein